MVVLLRAMFPGLSASLRWGILTAAFAYCNAEEMLHRHCLPLFTIQFVILQQDVAIVTTTALGHKIDIIASKWKPKWRGVVNTVRLHHQEPVSLEFSEKRVNAKAFTV